HRTLSLITFYCYRLHQDLHSFPTRRSSDLIIFCKTDPFAFSREQTGKTFGSTRPKSPFLILKDHIYHIARQTISFGKIAEAFTSHMVLTDTSAFRRKPNITCPILKYSTD